MLTSGNVCKTHKMIHSTLFFSASVTDGRVSDSEDPILASHPNLRGHENSQGSFIFKSKWFLCDMWQAALTQTLTHNHSVDLTLPAAVALFDTKEMTKCVCVCFCPSWKGRKGCSSLGRAHTRCERVWPRFGPSMDRTEDGLCIHTCTEAHYNNTMF